MAQVSRDFDPRIFQQLFCGTRQPAFACDAQSLRMLDANDAAVRLFGYSRRRLFTLSLADLSTASAGELLQLLHRRAGELASLTLRARRRDGRFVRLEGVATPMSYGGFSAYLILGGRFGTLHALDALPRPNADAVPIGMPDLRARRQDALTHFAKSALAGRTIQELLVAAAQLLQGSLRLDFCLAYELVEREGALVCRAGEGWSGDVASLRFDPMGKTVAARSLRARAPVAAENVEPRTRPEEAEWFYHRYGVRAAIGIPVRLDDVSYGSIVAYSRTPRRFTEDEIHYLETVADFIAIAADRERARREAEVTRDRIGDILESIVEHFVHVDRNWRISFVNVTVSELFARPAEAMIGEPVAQWFPSFADPRYRPHYEAAMHDGRPAQFEFQSLLSDRWYEARVRPLSDGIGAYFLDITERRRAEAARWEQERRTRALIETLPAITWMTDADLRIVTSLGGALRNLGLKNDELAGKSLYDLFERDSPTIAAHERALSGESADYVDTFEDRSFHSHVVPMIAHDGMVTGVAGLTIDVTDKVRAELRLEDAQALARFGTWSVDLPAGERTYSRELLRIFGRTAAEMPQDFRDLSAFVPPADAVTLQQSIERAIETHSAWNVDHRIVCGDGEVRYVQNVGQYTVDKGGRPVRGFGSILDITERKTAALALEQLANFDSLTGLANRVRIIEHLRCAIEEARENGECVAVCCLDLDRFTASNHTMGHGAGDELLRSVGERLSSIAAYRGDVARIGSDEFAVVFRHVSTPAAFGRLSGAVRRALGAPFTIAGRDLFVTASAGFSFFPKDGSTPEQLLRCADTALYEAKEAGGDHVAVFLAGMEESAGERLELRNGLYRALEREEFRLHYQPIVRPADRAVIGVEALIRWQHPNLGLVAPDRFIPLAEETGLIVPIGAWVLSSACREAATWPANGMPAPYVSVNLSARQFSDPELLAVVAKALDAAALPRERLCLEVTESLVVRDMLAGAATLRAIRSLGVSVAIDDFGTGYSSLGYLRSFRFDRLKLDRSFVNGLPARGEDAAIARGVIALGHAMGMEIIAEGVETEQQAELLRLEQCDALQGFLISRPVPRATLHTLL